MLLAADGSTTRLLESLVQAPLTLSVAEQCDVRASGLPPGVRLALGCGGDAEVVERRSELRLRSAKAVSVNYVAVLRRDARITEVLTSRRTAIGHGLRDSGLVLGRRLLSAGLSDWVAGDGPAGRQCAFKEYLLLNPDERPAAYIHERFNPDYVPTGITR